MNSAAASFDPQPGDQTLVFTLHDIVSCSLIFSLGVIAAVIVRRKERRK